jgi:hypothetical protein
MMIIVTNIKEMQMRLIKKDGQWTPHFTVAWEAAYLAERDAQWVPFSMSQGSQPVGEIHAQTFAIRFYNEEPTQERCIVSLSPQNDTAP